MRTSFIKKKKSFVFYNSFKPILDHTSRPSPTVSSKLFAKSSRLRNIHAKAEKTLNIFKFITLSPSFSKFRRSLVSLQVDKSLKNFSSTKYKSTSLLNGRCLSSSNDFKLSRVSLRKLATVGNISGVFKASW